LGEIVTDLLGGFQVNYEFECSRLLDRQAWPVSVQRSI
jgi:hypothetical protein